MAFALCMTGSTASQVINASFIRRLSASTGKARQLPSVRSFLEFADAACVLPWSMHKIGI